MDKIKKKLDGYRINLPSDILNELNIPRSGEVDLTRIENGLIITRSGEEPILTLQEEKSDLVYSNKEPIIKVKVNKKKEIYIPKAMFDKYNLALKKYSVLYSYFRGEVSATLIVSDKGNYKYRKDNCISINQIFPEFNIEQGLEIEVSCSDLGNILLTFKADKKEQEIKSFTIHHLTPDQKRLKNLEKEFVKVAAPPEIRCSELALKDTFKAQIRKRYVITIPNDLFKKYELSNAKFNYKIDTKLDGVTAILTLDKNGKFSFQKSNILPIKYIFNSICSPNEGDTVDCTLDNNSLSIRYTEIKIPHLETKLEEKDNKEFKESDDILEQVYLDQIENFKSRNISFKFIEESDLPKEKFCSRCGTKLTKKDNSMMSGHRVCNSCKSKKLKELFKPIKELAKIRQKRGE